jgi:predicted small secreted protein
VKKLTAILFISTLALALSACNTISGVGKDVQKAGEKVEEAAEKN